MSCLPRLAPARPGLRIRSRPDLPSCATVQAGRGAITARESGSDEEADGLTPRPMRSRLEHAKIPSTTTKQMASIAANAHKPSLLHGGYGPATSALPHGRLQTDSSIFGTAAVNCRILFNCDLKWGGLWNLQPGKQPRLDGRPLIVKYAEVDAVADNAASHHHVLPQGALFGGTQANDGRP